MSDRFDADQFIRDYKSGTARLTDAYGYNPAQEMDSCGVGLVVALDGKRRRDVVAAGIDALKAVWHRGAVDADGKTGDGAGIHVEIPQDFFKDHVRDSSGQAPEVGRIAVGMVFLPRTDLGAQERCRIIVETEILRAGHTILGWRQVPVDISVIGEKANATRPEIEQILIGRGNPQLDNREFEKQLYILRRRMEKAAIAENIGEFYVCSLSCRSVVYKGMFLAEHLSAFYPDLLDERFTSRFAIFHQRYSTNTFPQWKLAQPFRVLAHNGEINTILGNVNWMKSHEARLEHDGFGRAIEDLKPIIQPEASDSSALDNVFELLVRGHRNLPMVKLMMIPEASSSNPNVPAKHRAMYNYVNGVMEPWDGPAAIAAVAGKWALVGMDRNGLRPMRYVRTSDELLIAGSEAGMVPQDEGKIVEKGRLGPGEMLAVDMDAPQLFKDGELKDMLADTHDYAQWTTRTVELDSLIKQDAPATEHFAADELRRRQFSVGWSIEDLEMILHPMVEDGKEAVGSMGDDAPLAVLSDTYRGMHHFFRQNFSQVTNPPIDSLRERNVMTIRTRLGNLGNILDESPEQSEMLSLQSPIVLNAEFEAMRKYMGETACRIDCTFDARGGLDAMRQAFDRICKEAEDGVRSGCLHVVLTDANVDAERAALPMIMAAGGVHSYLVRQSLRTFISLNVRSAECLDVHYAAVIIGVGATTVNPYLAEETIAARHKRGLFGKLSLAQCLANYKKALDDGLLKVMSKMGISVLSSYRGGCNFEAVGLSRSLVQEFFPGMPSRISGIGLRGVQEKIAEQHQRAFDEDVIALPIGGFYKMRRGGDRHNFEGNLIHMLQDAVATESYEKYRRYSAEVRRLPPINLRDLLDFRTDRAPIAIDEVEIDHRAAQAPGGARHLARRAGTGGARDAVDRHEPHRRQVRFGRRRRGPGALSAALQRRQRLLGHQAGGVGPLRRHGGVSQQLPRARDQGGPGRQARRGRPAAGPQGQRDDRQAASFDAGRDADQPAAASRHLLDRGSGAADLRPEADQPRGAGHGEAGGALGHRHHRGRRRQGQGRRDPRLRPQRRHGRLAPDQHQVRRHPVGDGAVGDPPGADAEPSARQGAAAHRRRHQDRPRRGGRRHAGRRGVRHRHGLADRHGLHHGAAVPFQHLPGRRVHAGSQAARQVRGLAGEGGQSLQLHRRGGAHDPGSAGLPLAARRRRPLGPAEAGEPRRALSRRPRSQSAADPGRRRARDGALHGRGPQRGARHARRADDPRRPAAVHPPREDAAAVQRAEHPSRRGHAPCRHDHAQVRHGRAAARHRDGAPARHGRPVARRLCGAGHEARSVRRRQRLCRQGAERRHHRGQAHDLEPAGAAGQRHHRQHGPLRRHGGQAVRLRPRRRALRRAATRAPTPWSRAWAPTAAST